ncbi:MAG: hypothetical protein FD127_1008 [Acidimicrobiaceae bacterium]|nr:MAG: hypothetical protein FD127_1008 [Acidimicrobiaceae bacterium]
MLFTPMRIGGIARAAYGSATAMLQGDRSGSDVMLRDLEAICEDLDEALWAIAILTLERLATAYELRPPGGGSEPMATTILARADGFGRSTLSVRAAASRRRIDRRADRRGIRVRPPRRRGRAADGRPVVGCHRRGPATRGRVPRAVHGCSARHRPLSRQARRADRGCIRSTAPDGHTHGHARHHPLIAHRPFQRCDCLGHQFGRRLRVGAGHAMARCRVVRHCPVRRPCLDHAYRNELTSGFFGGFSPTRRREMTHAEAIEELSGADPNGGRG